MNIIITTTSKEPIYEQIKKQIQLNILKGVLKEGDPLPSIRQLAKELRVSVITSKKSYEELEREGYIVSSVGRGSFVASNTVQILKEKQRNAIKDKLRMVIDEARLLDIDLDEMVEKIKLLYQEAENIE